MNKIKNISVCDINDIASLLQKFPEAQNIDLLHTDSTGIGYTLYVKFDYEVNGIMTELTIPVVDESNW